ncbi:MAG: hypothetical protein K2H90_07050 [Oscillospiraceae bacterium]|nr:hypothetical protein [Oscillospiraceae bacterium]
MINDYLVTELWDLLCLYAANAFTALTQKSIFVLIIQGVLITLSFWDKNSRLFVILTAIGLYSVYGSFSVWVDLRRMELAAKQQSEVKWKQYRRTINLRHRNLLYDEIIFIPETNNEEDNFNKLYRMEYATNFERNYNYV